MRSINTSLIALLPVAGLLFVGAGLLGAGTLKDLALVLFVGLAAGAYSSIFLATPIVCDLKEREPKYAALAKRVAARQAAEARGVPVGAAERRARRGAAKAASAKAASAEPAEDEVLDAEPAEDEEPAPAAAGTAAARARTGGGSSPRPGARPKRPQQRRGGGGRPSAKKRR